MLQDKMIARHLLLLVVLSLWEELLGCASASKIVRRRGVSGLHAVKLGESRSAGQWDESEDSNALPMVTLRNTVSHEQASATGSLARSKLARSLGSNKERQSFKPKREVDSVSKQELPLFILSISKALNQDGRKGKNNTKSVEAPRLEKTFTIHHKSDVHSNKTRFKSGSKSRSRADLSTRTTGVPERGLNVESNRKRNLTGSYGVLKLLSKENLVRIVNSQMQKVPGLSFPSKGSRSRKRDLIDVNHGQLEAQREPRQDMAATQSHVGYDNQTAFPYASSVTDQDPNQDHGTDARSNPPREVKPALSKGQEHLGIQSSDGGDNKSKHLVHFLSTPHSEVSSSPEDDVAAGQTEPPFTSTKHLPVYVLPEKNDSPPSVLTMQPLGARLGNRAADSHRDPLTESAHTAQTELSTDHYLTDEDHKLVNNSHVLRLHPAPKWSHGTKDTEVQAVDSENGMGLVFEEAESEVEEPRDPVERRGARSRSRRSWIWNQFFVIEEYAGPEPVLIGRLHTDMDRNDGRTKYILRGEGAGSVFVIDEKTGNIHVTKPLDREEKDEYRLIATATDRQTERPLEPSSQFIIRVQDINDNPPVFDEAPYTATVPEMANIGTSIIQVTATDADDPTYGNSAKLVYTLVQGQQYFSVDPQTGILRTAVPDMDRETQDQYLVVLQAKDMGGHLGGLSGTTTVTVKLTDVNDNPPRFTQSMWSFSVSELAIPGAEIGRISATDADLGENAKLEYIILEGESGDTFNITGLDQEALITLNKAVDYESRSSYSFSVEVLNPIVDPRFLPRGPFRNRASIRVAVLDADEPPRFSRSRYLMDVSENCPPACTVGRVSAVDPDTGLTNNIRFSIDPQSDPEALFRITPDAGLITTAMELDREREHWHNITVIATQRDNPTQVSRVLVAIETLDLNDNAPELDRQYTTALCDSSNIGKVVQVLRAIDRDEGGNDSTVYFSIPPESTAALNFSVRDSGGPTASLVLLSQLQPLSRSSSSTLTLYVPLTLRDGTSGLTSTGTVTVSVCPCLRGGARAGEKEKEKQAEGEWDWEKEAVCLPQQSMLPSPGLSTAALLAILACVATLLAVSALSLSLRRQKRDSLSPLEEDDVRENIITYDDEGGGEADTAAFDISALQSAPHSSRSRGYRTLDSRNIRYTQHGQDKSRTYSWAQTPGVDHTYSAPGGHGGPVYGPLCYSSHTLPVLRRTPGGTFDPGLAELAYRIPGGQPDHSLVIQNQGAMVGPKETGAMYVAPTDLSSGSRTGSRTGSRDGTATQSGVSTSDGGTPRTNDSKERGGGSGAMNSCVEGSNEDRVNHNQDLDWVQSETLPREHNLVMTRSGSLIGQGHLAGGWVCDSATLPIAGRRASRSGFSPKRTSTGLAEHDPSGDGGGGNGGGGDGGNGARNGNGGTSRDGRNYAPVLQGEVSGQIDYSGTLGRGGLEMGSNFVVPRPDREIGGLSLTGSPPVYPEAAGFMGDWRDQMGLGGFVLGRRDMSPQLLPFPGQPRGTYGGVMGYGPSWVPGMEAVRGPPGPGGPSLALRVGEFLRLRLAQVTYDPSQPPYDSVQVYGLEGTGSRAGSLSSLESEGEKEDWGAGLEEWGPQFQKLAQLFKSREKAKEDQEDNEEVAKKERGIKDELEKKDKNEQAGDEGKD
uniref:Cadherin 24, type 2 n=1 Tax=Nothobranchius korthausae TaxID=1143690 RepID=A0A1A8FUM8_9TELE